MTLTGTQDDVEVVTDWWISQDGQLHFSDGTLITLPEGWGVWFAIIGFKDGELSAAN